MENRQNLQIGNTTLEGVLTLPKTKVDEERLRKLKEILDTKPLAMEIPVLQSLKKTQKEETCKLIYPTLDLSFLGMPNQIEYQGREIYASRFSVYPLDQNEFSMRLFRNNDESKIGMGIIGGMVAGTIGGGVIGGLAGDFGLGLFVGEIGGTVPGGIIGNIVRVRDYKINITFPNLPGIFSDELIKSTEFSRYAEPVKEGTQYTFKLKDVPKDIRKRYKNLGNIALTSKLVGLVPAEIKERIDEAEATFQRENLYLIAETTPKEWNIKKIVPKADPVVVGVAGEKCFYVDRFDTTKLEDYISREFTN